MAKNKYIKNPEELLLLWDEYKKSVGFDEIEQATSRGEIVVIKVRKPLLKSGFEVFAYRKLGFGIGQYLDNQDKAYNEYLDVTTCIRREWETDQISGTLTGKYKAPNLTARLNNFADTTNVNATIKTPIFGENPLDEKGNE